MIKINIHEAKTHLSRYVEEAAQGKEVVIVKAGKPIARIAPLAPPKAKRKLGLLGGKARIPDDFNSSLPDEVLAEFLGGK
jgi:prevent-host-death family protein